MLRSVQPEILDGLPACNRDAIHSRRDLVKINALMGNFRWLGRRIRASKPEASDRIIEIGAGDGTLAKKLVRDLHPIKYAALDQCGSPADFPQSAKWITGDLLDFDNYHNYTCLVANLTLHHFEAGELEKLGERIREGGIRRIFACEPCRRSFHKHQLRAGRWIGFNYVTLNDGSVSIDAGFRGAELPNLLGLDPELWSCDIQETWMGAYRMMATRK